MWQLHQQQFFENGVGVTKIPIDENERKWIETRLTKNLFTEKWADSFAENSTEDFQIEIW